MVFNISSRKRDGYPYSFSSSYAIHKISSYRGWHSWLLKRSGKLMSPVRKPAELLRYIARTPRRGKQPVARLLNQERRCDLKSSLSSVTKLRDKKRLASHSDSTIGFLGPDLAAPKMHCSTTITRRQETRREPGDQGFTGCILPMQRMSSGRARARVPSSFP